jgi:TRAP-type C4-dicarboxylate transport system permease small subunit
LLAFILAATPTPSPGTPADDLVSPTWVGFAVTFALAVVTVLLIVDMTRRIRGVRYRAEVRERLENEQSDTEA